MQKLYTAAGASLSGIPWNEYPRPQLRRADWLCLNGTWELTAGGRTAPVRVPFCPESLLSGWDGPVPYGEEMVWRRTFTVPESWAGRRVLIHLGAVNRIAVVRVNGASVAAHENGYLSFSADVTDRLSPGENELSVLVVSDLSVHHPWGKLRRDRGGMWYTPVSGLWQTVWLEPVPETYVRGLTIKTDATGDGSLLHSERNREPSPVAGYLVEIAAEGVPEGVVTLEDGRRFPLTDGKARIPIEAPRLWSPEDPYLYPFTLEAGEDRVASYFALRTLSVEEVGGVPRLCLNGKPYFFHGVLDQGLWSDGLYTPAAPDGFERDILAMKSLGFNTLRKHVKVEPERFYYDCDRLGMIVFQDMVNTGRYHYLRDTVLPTLGFLRRRDKHLNRSRKARESFLAGMEGTVRQLYNHPCICLWTIFNEGWGQFRADEAYDRLRALDGTRFIDSTSGWFSQTRSDVESLHIYFQKPHLGKERRPQLLSEFGGWSFKLPAHSFNLSKTYGYRKYDDPAAFVRDLRALYLEQLVPLAARGLCGAIYTQVSDVEDETNGFLTWDREVMKLAPDEMRDIAAKLTDAVAGSC